MKKKFYLVRHGEIVANVNKIYAGWSNEGLTARGVGQAEEAARKLADKEIGYIFCSPLRRAVQTAEIIGDHLRLPVAKDDSFKEFQYGDWAGRHEEEIARLYPADWQLWNSRPGDLLVEGRETLSHLQARVLAGMAQIRAEYPAARILVVTHVAIIRVALLHTANKDLNQYKTIDVPNAEIFEVDL